MRPHTCWRPRGSLHLYMGVRPHMSCLKPKKKQKNRCSQIERKRRRARMRMSKALAAVVAISVSLSAAAMGVDATVESTCSDAAASDKRVHLAMCLSQLGHHRDADAWGLAKAATLVGVDKADLAADDIKELEAGASTAGIKPALAEFAKQYRGLGFAFASAHDVINNRAYDVGEKKLDEALSLTQKCNAAFAKIGVPLQQPLAQLTADTIQIAIIAKAITCLVNVNNNPALVAAAAAAAAAKAPQQSQYP
nr:pectinesterase inhibitor 12-like [Oryza sativa Japonica Group]